MIPAFPARRTPRRTASGPAALALAVLLLAGCGAPGVGTGPSSPPGTTRGQQPSSSSPAPSPVPTEGWKSHARHGLVFKYPPQWSIAVAGTHEYDGVDVLDEDGDVIAHFASNTAVDTDGDVGSYARTDLDRVPAPNIALNPADVVFEFSEVTNRTEPQAAPRHQAILLLADREQLDSRTDEPWIPYFVPIRDTFPWFWTTEEFIDAEGVDPEDPTLEQARDFMSTERYRTMKAVLLSVDTQ